MIDSRRSSSSSTSVGGGGKKPSGKESAKSRDSKSREKVRSGLLAYTAPCRLPSYKLSLWSCASHVINTFCILEGGCEGW